MNNNPFDDDDEIVNNILNVNVTNVTMTNPYHSVPLKPKLPEIPATIEYAQNFITTHLMNTMLYLFYKISPPTMEYFHRNCNQGILSSITQLVNNKKENNAFLDIILNLKPPFTDLTWKSIKEQLDKKDSQMYKTIEDLSEIDKENKDLQIIVRILKYAMLYLRNKNKPYFLIQRKSVSSYESKKNAAKKISEWMLNILYSPDYKCNFMYKKTKINFERKKIKHE